MIMEYKTTVFWAVVYKLDEADNQKKAHKGQCEKNVQAWSFTFLEDMCWSVRLSATKQ